MSSRFTRRELLLASSAIAASSLLRQFGAHARVTEAAAWSDLDRRLQRAVDDGTFAGIGLLLCTAEETLYEKAFGADTTETTHLLGSATKLASTTAIMTLVDDRLIALDDPIRKYLPQFGPNRGAITIRQVFAQLHGMPADHPAIARPQEDNGYTLEQAVNEIAKDDSLLYAPGAMHFYRPAASYHIGGRIAELVTGEPWNALFAKRVSGPLEMRTFTYGSTPNPRIGGGAKCALRDYGNLLSMHLAGGVFRGRRVLSEQSVVEMQKDQLHGVEFTPVETHPAHGYGLSWWFDVVGAGGEPVQMSVPGVYGAIPWLDRELGYGGFQLVGKRLPPSSALYREIYPLINERMSRAA